MDSSLEKNTVGPSARLKCAFYGLYSTQIARPKSIEDQFRICSEFAESRGWEIVADHIYGDVGRCGMKGVDRVGLEALKVAAQKHPRPFECILFEDTFPLGRNQKDVLTFTRLMKSHGIKVHFINQMLDSSDENFEIILNAFEAMNQMYINAFRAKVFRGQKAGVLQGFHVGRVPYGYQTVPVYDRADPTAALGCKLEVAEEQAAIVRRIFQQFVDGNSVGAISRQLNAEKIPSPGKVRAGQADAAWSNKAINRILRNPIYRGEIQWNVSCRGRQLLTGKVKREIKPAHEHVRVASEHLRIVDDPLWFRAAERLKRVDDKKTAVITSS